MIWKRLFIPILFLISLAIGISHAIAQEEELPDLTSEEIEVTVEEFMERFSKEQIPAVSDRLNDLAIMYYQKGKYDKAIAWLFVVLKLQEKTLDKDHADVATSLNNLAALLKAKGDYEGAEPLYRRSLSIRESTLGKDHPTVATSL
ncbi:MAG: tetratricopeptide repeat protein, partial [Candidatus Brocadiae bacterium]|nr:tetratricopeptide repeat protein [Candidatus Brocadiia bacterium]